jgi:hypothetical protein
MCLSGRRSPTLTSPARERMARTATSRLGLPNVESQRRSWSQANAIVQCLHAVPRPLRFLFKADSLKLAYLLICIFVRGE